MPPSTAVWTGGHNFLVWIVTSFGSIPSGHFNLSPPAILMEHVPAHQPDHLLTFFCFTIANGASSVVICCVDLGGVSASWSPHSCSFSVVHSRQMVGSFRIQEVRWIHLLAVMREMPIARSEPVSKVRRLARPGGLHGPDRRQFRAISSRVRVRSGDRRRRVLWRARLLASGHGSDQLTHRVSRTTRGDWWHRLRWRLALRYREVQPCWRWPRLRRSRPRTIGSRGVPRPLRKRCFQYGWRCWSLS